MAQAADSDAAVLITGETGTGKELFARAIHANSSRVNSNFVVVDCAALPETLVESVLFGHVKGAFTGADRDRDGLFKLADGGTLFLDEIGELSPGIQKTFLRVLQDGRFRPVGSKNELQSDFRLVAATNRDLVAMDSSGVGALVRLQTALATRGKRLILANPLPAVADELRLRDLSGFFLLSWDIHPDMGQEALLLASDA